MRIAKPGIVGSDWHEEEKSTPKDDLDEEWDDGLAPGIILELFLVVPGWSRNTAQESKSSTTNQIRLNLYV